MSGKRRIVPVLVDDERVTEINLEYRDQDGYLGVSVVPVPPDDQLAHDIRRLARLADANARAMDHANDRYGADALRGSAARLRAAFQLGEEE